MTNIKSEYNCKKRVKNILTCILIIICSVVLSGILSDDICNYAKEGLRLCFRVIVGSVFPFMILTDIITYTAKFENIYLLRCIFEKLFKINGRAISAFIIGIICGFPIGVKVASDLYKQGVISKEETERLIGFSNNTGPAFVISGIGLGMRNSISDGVILYFSMLLSAIISGILFGVGKSPTKSSSKEHHMDYSLTKSVKNSAQNTVNICGFVVLFSVIIGILSIIIRNELIYSLVIPFLEVSNCAKRLTLSNLFSKAQSLMLTSFAISFSGISVHMQAKSFLLETDLSMKTYYQVKLTQGIISAILTGFILCIK